MKIKDIMSKDVSCCTPDTGLQEVARMMVECDCGEIPVVDDRTSMRPVGVITDRDITCRAVAQGKNPLQLTARDCMTSPVVTSSPDADIDECVEAMQDHKIRRLPIVDGTGRLCGIVAQADIALRAGKGDTAKVVKEVSERAPVATR